MTEQDLLRIEDAIGRPVSKAFRQFMLHPPSQLGMAMELLCDPNAVIEFNRSGATADWPENQLGLGDNGCGDVYSIDLDDPRGAVYLSGPHSGFDSPDENAGGRMTGQPIRPALPPDEAWERLVGTWVCRFEATNSVSERRLRFTPSRKLVRSNSLSGGVLPMPMTNETTSEVLNVSVKKDAILLTMGTSTMGRGGGMLTLRFVAANQIVIEDGSTYTREE
jgi:hypothetical protein